MAKKEAVDPSSKKKDWAKDEEEMSAKGKGKNGPKVETPLKTKGKK